MQIPLDFFYIILKLFKLNALKKYGIDLVEQARNGKIDPVIGREEEIRRKNVSSDAKLNNLVLHQSALRSLHQISLPTGRISRHFRSLWLCKTDRLRENNFLCSLQSKQLCNRFTLNRTKHHRAQIFGSSEQIHILANITAISSSKVLL